MNYKISGYIVRKRKADFFISQDCRTDFWAPYIFLIFRIRSSASRSVWACNICEYRWSAGWRRCVTIFTLPWHRYRVAMIRQHTSSTASSPGARRWSASRWRLSCKAVRATISGMSLISLPSIAGKTLIATNSWMLKTDVNWRFREF